ncbi:hypothetical protein GCM10009119_23290 [Algoriphagus jejuensis]|uniref:AAA domain-containing protein n=1 Tax=Algoriphagus jejuensis TaxID=419934 RepID=A0ABP3YD88_9BACT
MIKRDLLAKLQELMPDFLATGILGSRQVGKTTLAQTLVEGFDSQSIYLDLENPSDRVKLVEQEQYFDLHEGKLIILDFVIQMGSQLWAVEIKRTRSPKLSKDFLIASKDVEATHQFVVYTGNEEFPLGENTNTIGLADLMQRLKTEGH